MQNRIALHALRNEAVRMYPRARGGARSGGAPFGAAARMGSRLASGDPQRRYELPPPAFFVQGRQLRDISDIDPESNPVPVTVPEPRVVPVSVS